MQTYRLEQERSALPFTFGRTTLGDSGYHRHSHDFSELVIITGGSGIHSADGKDYPVVIGDIFVLQTGLQHGFSRCNSLSMYNIGFMDNIIPEQALREVPGIRVLFDIEPRTRSSTGFSSKFHAGPLEMETIHSHLDSMERELRRRLPGYSTVTVFQLITLVILLGRYYSQKSSMPVLHLMKLAEGLYILEQHFNEFVEIGAIADQIGLSRAHFIRSFKRAYHLTPLQYLLQLRMGKAVEMLAETKIPVSEIAFSCGFSDSNYFSRVFRKRLGVSPREFRSNRKRLAAT